MINDGAAPIKMLQQFATLTNARAGGQGDGGVLLAFHPGLQPIAQRGPRSADTVPARSEQQAKTNQTFRPEISTTNLNIKQAARS